MSSVLQPLQDLQRRIADYWFGLSARERQLVSVTGCLLVVWLGYFGMIRPVQNYLASAEQRLQGSERLYQDVVARAEKIVQLRGKSGVVAVSSDQPLDAEINRTASKSGMTITGLNRQQGSLQVRMQNTEFRKLVNWLISLEQTGIKVTTLQLGRTDKPGIVEVQQLRVAREGL